MLLVGLAIATIFSRESRSADDDLTAEVKVLIAKFKEDLKSKTPATRASAYKTIAELGDKAKSERRTMCEGLMDVAPIVRTAAADCLKKVDENTYKLAMAVMIDKDIETILDMKKLGTAAAPIAPILLKFAGDHSPVASRQDATSTVQASRRMLTACVNTLVAIAPEDVMVNQAVIRMLGNPVPELRDVAVGNVSALKNKKLALTGLLTVAGNPQDFAGTRVKALSIIPDLVDENTSAPSKKALEKIRFDDVRAVREAVEDAMKKIK